MKNFDRDNSRIRSIIEGKITGSQWLFVYDTSAELSGGCLSKCPSNRIEIALLGSEAAGKSTLECESKWR